jgi:HSP20 family protein
MTAEHDLLKKFLALQERIHSVFEDSLATRQDGVQMDLGSTWAPPVDVYETAHEWVLTAEIPGMDQEKVDLRISENVLTLRGERELAGELERQTYHRLERPSGHFERKFALPEAVDHEAVKARMENGVLIVSLPKKTSRRRMIKVETGKK